MAEALLRRLCKRHRVPLRTISALGRQRLLAYAWPGNVRELAHELERAIVFSEGNDIQFEHLPGQATGNSAGAEGDALPRNAWFNERFEFPPEGFSLDEATHRLIQHALQQTHGNVSAAARLLGVSRDVVRYRLDPRKDAP